MTRIIKGMPMIYLLSILLTAAIIVEAFHGIYHHPRSSHSATIRRRSRDAVTAAHQKPSGDVDRNNDDNDDHPKKKSSSSTAHLIFPGGGIYFYWQAGVVTFLRENGYNLQATTMTGASTGALTATLAATGVDFYEATDLALSLADRAGVWKRSGGLQGIWGELIYEWLHELIPATTAVVEHQHDEQRRWDGNDNHRNKLTLLVTPFPDVWDRKLQVSSFHDKNDLIAANMASIHLPWFLNSQLTATFRGRSVIDGSFLAQAEDYAHPVRAVRVEESCSNIVVDFKMDPLYRDQNLLSFIETVDPSKIRQMLEDGKRYAQRLEEQGYFTPLAKL
jgi:predicted acylesterase/phospholipase RssA